MRALAGLMAVVIFVAAAGEFFGYLRAGIAVAMFAVIAWLGVSYFSGARQAPSGPEPEELGDEEIHYVCSMCGLDVRVEIAGVDRPPTHCREPMKLVASRPPLRPVP
jgi:hypothetical protein